MKQIIIDGKIGNETYCFKAKVLSINADNLSLIVADEREALLTTYYYRRSSWTRIERGSNNEWIVVIYKSMPI